MSLVLLNPPLSCLLKLDRLAYTSRTFIYSFMLKTSCGKGVDEDIKQRSINQFIYSIEIIEV